MTLISAADYTQYPTIDPDFTYHYGNDGNQFGDLYLPENNAQHPVIILVHGGCWRAEYGLKPLGTICQTLVADGFAVWNIEYRRAGNGGEYPNYFHDLGNATDYLRQIADKHHLNLDQVLTVGHSAGGHAALWIAARHRIPTTSDLYMDNPLPIHGVVSLAGIADLDFAIENDVCEGALPIIMGGDNKAVPDHYQAGSPRALLPLGMPQIHINGELDTDFMDSTKSYIIQAQQVGDAIEFITPADAGHFEIVTVSSPTWQIVHDAILKMRDMTNT